MSNAKCCNSFYSIFGPLFTFFFFFFFFFLCRFAANFFPPTEKKMPKIGLGASSYAAKVSSHTYAHGFVKQTFFFSLGLTGLCEMLWLFSFIATNNKPHTTHSFVP